MAAVDEVNQVVQEGVGMRNHGEVLALCDQGEVPASLLYSVADIFEDEQYQARENIRVMDSRAGEVAVPNVIPKLSETPGALEWLGEELGGHNDEIFRDVLGLSVAQIEALRVSGVI